MIAPLISTKLYLPPDSKKFVPRQSLVERLNAGLWEDSAFARRITIVSAPAGFGKTTLVTQWLRRVSFPCTWLSLDENDNDPRQFLGYVIAALQHIYPDIGATILGQLNSFQPPSSSAILTALVNEIAAQGSAMILAIDDYHLIQEQAIHQQLNFLLEFQPSNLHLVIMTREDPPLPISRLRARRLVLEIRQSDLCFTEEETRLFLLQELGFELQDEDILSLLRRTEGWAVGLQLAALSLQGHADTKQFILSFTGSNRYILDYLMDEVLSRQTQAVQDFLMKTSILDRLTAPLCDSVCNLSHSDELLETLESANLFIIPLDTQREWYRYHRLFAENLRHRVRISKTIPLRELHIQASIWLEQHDFIPEAVQHALLAEDWPRAISMIQGELQEMLKRGEVATLLGWFHKLPEQVVLSHPELSVDFCWPLILSGQLETAERLLSQVETQLKVAELYQGEIAALHAYIARSRGDTRRTVIMSQRALALMPDDEHGFREGIAINLGIAQWHEGEIDAAEKVFLEAQEISAKKNNQYALLTALVFQNRIQAARGQLQHAYQAYQPLAALKGDIPILALVHLDLSALHYEYNDLENCEKHIQASIAVSERTQNGEFLIGGYAQLVRLRLAAGDLAGAINTLQVTERLLQQHTITPLNRMRNAALHVQVDLLQDDIISADTWAALAGEAADAHNFYPFLGLTPARILLAKNRKLEALEYLNSIFETASKAGWSYGQVAIQVLQALAAANKEDAVNFLIQAVQFGSSQGFLRTFIDAGEGLQPLLQELALRGISLEYVRKILSASEVQPGPPPSAQAALIEPLSDREIEVLRLVAAGLSNREIAAKLILSLGTVKSHIHNIYGKLDARNRTQAVSRARELELL